MDKTDIEFLMSLSRQAAKAIMEIFNTGDFSIERKEDNSPLTQADRLSHEIITSALKQRYPEIPVICEEDSSVVDYQTRCNWDRFWLVDPLDGTKEFCKREIDFTTNIALIEHGKPVLGIVYAPARDWMYTGDVASSLAVKYTESGEEQINCTRNRDLPVIAVRSKSHAQPDEQTVLDHFGATETTSMGSSLKFCLVAEGKADLYFRSGPTWEWDSAAAHAVVLAAGAKVYNENWQERQELTYNKPTLKNDHGFLCLGSRMEELI